jgi:hypothetical protein
MFLALSLCAPAWSATRTIFSGSSASSAAPASNLLLGDNSTFTMTPSPSATFSPTPTPGNAPVATQAGPESLLPPPPPPAELLVNAAGPKAVSDSATAAAMSFSAEGSPLPPSFLTAIADNGSIVLSWDSAHGPRPISGYLVYRATFSNSRPAGALNKAPISGYSYLDNAENSKQPPRNRVAYWYRVRAYDTDQELSDLSTEVSATPSGPLLPPANPKAQVGDALVSLSWSLPKSSGDHEISGYLIYRGDEAGKYGLNPVARLGAEALAWEDQGLKNGQSYHYALRSLDDAGNTSPASADQEASPLRPPAAPTNLTTIGLAEDLIKLKWQPSAGGGTYGVVGYNVYRSLSNTADTSLPPVNKVLVPEGGYYEDGSEYSLAPPKKGVTYYYYVAPVDEKGNLGKPGEPVKGQSVDSLNTLNLGTYDIASAQSSLGINGRKWITFGYTWQIDGQPSASLAPSGMNKGLSLDQQLQVRLQGQVGRKIVVDVDYDDKTEDKRKISIIYKGDRDEIVEDASFGDINLDLGHTEFVNYQKSLFGFMVKLRSPDNRLRLTGIGAQTTGITETKRFVGSMAPDMTGNVRGRDILDTAFPAYRYYYLTKDIGSGSHLLNGLNSVVAGSVSIWVDRQSAADRTSGLATLSTPKGQYAFIQLHAGTDYTVDVYGGIVTFNTSLAANYTLLVAFAVQSPSGAILATYGYTRPFLPSYNQATLNTMLDMSDTQSSTSDGLTSSSAHLIQDGAHSTQYDAHMLCQFYDLGNRNILDPKSDPDFRLSIVDTKNNNTLLPPPSDPSSANIYVIDPVLGLLKFVAPYPFALGQTFGTNQPLYSTLINTNQADAYRQPSQSNYHIHVEYKYHVTSYNLHIGIIRGSETVRLDGRRLSRDVDYSLDYDSGILLFINPDLVKDSSVVEASYEYSQNGGQYTSNVFGGRAEYDLTASKSLTVGSSFLFNGGQTPLTVPDVRSAPSNLSLMDADVKAQVTRKTVNQVLRQLTGIDGIDLPVEVSSFKAEVAHSWLNPNTYSVNGENGVAMVDDFESVENIVSTSVSPQSWLPSSIPQSILSQAGSYGGMNQVYAERRFSYLTTDTAQGHDTDTNANNINGTTTSLENMLEIDYSGFGDPNAWDSFWTSISHQGQALTNYDTLEVWVKASGPVVMHFELGVIDDDAVGTGIYSTESTTGYLAAGQDNGLPGYQVHYPNSPASYWGAGNNIINSDDIDGAGVLTTSYAYYHYSREVQPVSGNNGFTRLDIPLSGPNPAYSGDGTGGMYSNPAGQLGNVQGASNFMALVKHARVWFTVPAGASPSGKIVVESIQVLGNKWQVQPDINGADALGQPVQAVDASKFSVAAINKYTNSAYSPNLTYINQQQNADTSREQSLDVYNGMSASDRVVGGVDAGDPLYKAVRILTTGTALDFSPYANMKVDIYKPQATQPGEVLFLRLGSDNNDCYQYNFLLDNVPVNHWTTVTLTMDGSDGHRLTRGNAYLRYISEAILGVLNPNAASPGEHIYLDNLRVTDAKSREGTAYMQSTDVKLFEGKANLHESYRDVGSDFVQMDQQADPPKQHAQVLALSADAALSPKMQVSGGYTHSASFVDPAQQDDPGYSNSYSAPNTTSQASNGRLAYTGISGLSLNMNGSYNETRNEYLPAYVQQQREAYLNYPGMDPSNTQRQFTLAPQLSYNTPKLWPVLLHGENLQASLSYQESSTNYDGNTDTNTPYYDQVLKTRLQAYRYSGAYQLYFPGINLSPSVSYSKQDALGSLPAASVNQPYYELGPGNTLDRWVPQSEALNPILTLDMPAIKDLAPRVTYNFTNTRSYIENTLTTNGSLEAVATLKLGALLGVAAIPPLNFSQRWTVASIFDNTVPDEVDPSLSTTDRMAQRQSFWQGTWWVRIENWHLGENTNDPNNIEHAATSASRHSESSVNTSFGVTLPGLGWKATFTPRLGYNVNRDMTQRDYPTTGDQITAGTGMNVDKPRLFFDDFFKPVSMNLTYDYGWNDSLDRTDTPISGKTNHSYHWTETNKPTENLALTFDIAGANSWATTYYSLGGTTGTANSDTNDDLISAAIKTSYNLLLNQNYKMWDVWPFYGRVLKLTQRFQLDNNFTYTLHQTFSDVQASQLDTMLYSLTDNIAYNLLANVKGNLGLQWDWYNNLLAPGLSYKALTVKLGLDANF